jgi:hypothetical protein
VLLLWGAVIMINYQKIREPGNENLDNGKKCGCNYNEKKSEGTRGGFFPKIFPLNLSFA